MFRARPSHTFIPTHPPSTTARVLDGHARTRTRTRTRDSRQENQPPSNQPFTHCKQLGRDQSLARIVCVVVPRLLLVLQLPNPRLRPPSYFALQPPLPEPPAPSKNLVLGKRWPGSSSLICLPGTENRLLVSFDTWFPLLPELGCSGCVALISGSPRNWVVGQGVPWYAAIQCRGSSTTLSIAFLPSTHPPFPSHFFIDRPPCCHVHSSDTSSLSTKTNPTPASHRIEPRRLLANITNRSSADDRLILEPPPCIA